MSKHTTRDRIWDAALRLAEEKQDASTWARKFTAADVADRLENGPSARSIRDTLATMADLGHIERARAQGRYAPIEADGETSSTMTRKQSSTSSTKERMSADDVAMALEDDVQEDDDGFDLDGVEFPKNKTDEECTEAVTAAYEYIQEHGSATMRELVQEVLPEHPIGYEVVELQEGDRYRGAWWRLVVKPGLEALEDVEKPPLGGSDWKHKP